MNEQGEMTDKVKVSNKIHVAKVPGLFKMGGSVRDENGRYAEAWCGSRGGRVRAHYVDPQATVTCKKCLAG